MVLDSAFPGTAFIEDSCWDVVLAVSTNLESNVFDSRLQQALGVGADEVIRSAGNHGERLR